MNGWPRSPMCASTAPLVSDPLIASQRRRLRCCPVQARGRLASDAASCVSWPRTTWCSYQSNRYSVPFGLIDKEVQVTPVGASKAAAHRLERPILTAANPELGTDFVSDALFDGRRFRAFTLVDNFTHECLTIEPAQSLTGADVVQILAHLSEQRRGYPPRIQADNSPEFCSLALDKWAYENSVMLDFSRPGKSTDNAFIESINGSLRDECLNVNWFLSLEDAYQKLEN